MRKSQQPVVFDAAANWEVRESWDADSSPERANEKGSGGAFGAAPPPLVRCASPNGEPPARPRKKVPLGVVDSQVVNRVVYREEMGIMERKLVAQAALLAQQEAQLRANERLILQQRRLLQGLCDRL